MSDLWYISITIVSLGCKSLASIMISALKVIEQVAQLPMIAHLRASIMFGDTIIYDAQRQETLNLKH